METIPRLLKIDLPQGQSAFLWGPRKTGKTTYLRATFPNSRVYDLLQTDLFLEFAKRPFLLREQLLAASPKQLKEPVIIDEVQKVPQLLDEGLSRNIPAFSRFFEAMGFSHGELTNYANIARDCGIDAKTVKEYYQILDDTLLGTMIEPYKKRQERQVIMKAGKFYLFDVGVAGAITRRRIPLEVDFILGQGAVAIEVKGTSRVDPADLRPLKAFIQEYAPASALVVCNERAPRVHEDIRILPWRVFLKMLWSGEVLS